MGAGLFCDGVRSDMQERRSIARSARTVAGIDNDGSAAGEAARCGRYRGDDANVESGAGPAAWVLRRG